jgi:hypothetical protein
MENEAVAEALREALEREKGIEPSSQAWEARVLPLNHSRSVPQANEE